MEFKCDTISLFCLFFIIFSSHVLCCHWETWEHEPWAAWLECSATTCQVWGKQERYRVNNCHKYGYGGYETEEEWYNYCKQMDDEDDKPDIYQERTCQHCYNGGIFEDTQCLCMEGFEGTCCQEVGPILRPPCELRPADLIFLLDSSASILQENFDKQLKFVADLIDHFTIAPDETRVSVITFSTEATVEFYLNKHTSKAALKQAILSIPYRAGATLTHKGLKKVENVLDASNGGKRENRQYFKRFVVVLTDGMSAKRSETRQQAAIVRSLVDRVISVGIGFEVSHKELLDIATPARDPDPPYVYTVDDFTALYTLTKQLVHSTCQMCTTSHFTDVIFLFDDSVSHDLFQSAIGHVTYMVNKMEALGAHKGTQVGLATFGKEIHTLLRLDNGIDKSLLLPFFQQIQQVELTCDKNDDKCEDNTVDKIIQEIIETSFVAANGGREGAKQMIIVLTTGKYGDVEIVQDNMAIVRANTDVEIFAVGLGMDFNMAGVLSLVDDSAQAFVLAEDSTSDSLGVLQAVITYNKCDLSQG